MPLPVPILDDRSWQQLRDELVQRIPVYTPEWTDHNPSDPGITLLELFAFLGENLLYRFNQVPETTRLAFLRLLDVPLRPAAPARALVQYTVSAREGAGSLVAAGTEVRAGQVPFESRDEAVVLPLEAVAAVRVERTLPATTEARAFADAAIDALGGLATGQEAAYYETIELPADPTAPGAPVADVTTSVDGMLWIAVLRTDHTDPAALGGALLNLGVLGDDQAAGLDDVAPCEGTNPPADGGLELRWEASTPVEVQGKPQYLSLAVERDSTRGLTRDGVVRLHLPRDVTALGTVALDDPDRAGTGDLPPALGDPKQAARVLFWLRVWRRQGERRLGRFRWVGTNAVAVEQSRTARAEFLGTGTGDAGQGARLAHAGILPGTLTIEVEEAGRWVRWTEVPHFDASGEDDRHYLLDPEAGTVRFGNGVRGRAPQVGERIRALAYRYGGGAEGNVAAGKISRLDGVSGVKARNPLAARGGAPAESVAEGLQRIPGELRRRDRAVTATDFAELALATPGGEVGRAECLPRFHPPSRQQEAAGVVSVVVWPREDRTHPTAPVPDRTLLREVCCWLDTRRLVTTELWVIPPTYRRVAVALGVRIKPGYQVEAVRHWVERVVRQYLAPLPPGGPDGGGWPLGRRVHGPELEAAALQVEGVEYLEPRRDAAGCSETVAGWDAAQGRWVPGTVELAAWEVPELVELTVVEGPALPPGEALGPPPPPKVPVPIPVIRTEC